MTDIDEAIQTLADQSRDLEEAMIGKGLSRVRAEYTIGSEGVKYLHLHWYVGETEKYEFLYGDAVTERALAFIEKMPDAETRARNEFLRLTAAALDFANKHLPDAGEGISMIQAQLRDEMERLSSNIIEDQSNEEAPLW